MILLDYHNVIIKNTLDARLKEYSVGGGNMLAVYSHSSFV